MKGKQRSAFLSATVLAGLLVVAGCSQSGEQFSIDRSSVNGLPSVTSTASSTSQVTIEAIDYDNRSIALEGPDGKSEIFTVPPEVRNFDQIKKGDVVNVQYVESMDVNVRKVGEPLSTAEAASVAAAAAGRQAGHPRRQDRPDPGQRSGHRLRRSDRNPGGNQQ